MGSPAPPSQKTEQAMDRLAGERTKEAVWDGTGPTSMEMADQARRLFSPPLVWTGPMELDDGEGHDGLRTKLAPS